MRWSQSIIFPYPFSLCGQCKTSDANSRYIQQTARAVAGKTGSVLRETTMDTTSRLQTLQIPGRDVAGLGEERTRRSTCPPFPLLLASTLHPPLPPALLKLNSSGPPLRCAPVGRCSPVLRDMLQHTLKLHDALGVHLAAPLGRNRDPVRVAREFLGGARAEGS